MLVLCRYVVYYAIDVQGPNDDLGYIPIVVAHIQLPFAFFAQLNIIFPKVADQCQDMYIDIREASYRKQSI